MKKNTLCFITIIFLVACQQTKGIVTPIVTITPQATLTTTPTFTPTVTAVPTSIFTPYYGTPQPVKAIVDGKIYNSEIGTTMWVHIDSNGNQVMEIGDAFAVITSTQAIVVTSPFSLTLKLPIPINPTDLWYVLFAVSEKDKSQVPQGGTFRWIPKNQKQIIPPFLAEQQLTFSPDPGTYVLEVHAGWGGTKPWVELEADYGFLFEVQK